MTVTEQLPAGGAASTVASTSVRGGAPPEARPPEPRPLKGKQDRGDRIFHGGSLLSGVVVLGIMGAVGIFLTLQATQALEKRGVLDFITTQEWQPSTNQFGIASLIYFTVMISLVAICVSIPLAMGTALFITEVAPAKLRSTLVSTVDLMAAVPSVIYGLWGLYFLQGGVIGLSRWISTWFGWIPIFAVDGADPGSAISTPSVYTASTFIAGLVVCLMVMPIQCSIMREVFSQVPIGEREGAYALGGTRWGVIRIVSMPFARGGIIGGTMLGLGRALGETIAVVLIISPRFDITPHILEAGSNSVSAHIALKTFEASGFERSALFAAGLALFIMTLVVNFTASAFVARSRSGSASEA